MRYASTVRHWMHDETLRFIHYAGCIIHEKAFWGMVGIVVLTAAVFTILMVLGHDPISEYRDPQYLW